MLQHISRKDSVIAFTIQVFVLWGVAAEWSLLFVKAFGNGNIHFALHVIMSRKLTLVHQKPIVIHVCMRCMNGLWAKITTVLLLFGLSCQKKKKEKRRISKLFKFIASSLYFTHTRYRPCPVKDAATGRSHKSARSLLSAATAWNAAAFRRHPSSPAPMSRWSETPRLSVSGSVGARNGARLKVHLLRTSRLAVSCPSLQRTHFLPDFSRTHRAPVLQSGG